MKMLGYALVVAATVLAVQVEAAEPFRSAEQLKVNRSDLFLEGGSWVESIDLLFNVKSGGELLLGTSAGSVNVRTWSNDQVRWMITKRTRAASAGAARRILEMFRIQALHGGKDLQLTAGARTKAAHAVDVVYTIWVPKKYNLDVTTKRGSIELPEVQGRFSAHTDDGTITLDCDTENLDIEVEDSTDDLEQEGPPQRDENDTPVKGASNSNSRSGGSVGTD